MNTDVLDGMRYLPEFRDSFQKIEVLDPPFVEGKKYFIIVSKNCVGGEKFAHKLQDTVTEVLASFNYSNGKLAIMRMLGRLG